MYILDQYQVTPTQGSSGDSETKPTQSKQNGETPHSEGIKTTTIHIPSNPTHTSLPDKAPSSSNSVNSSIAEAARSRGLPASVVKFLADMPEPVRAPADSEIVHTEQDVTEWERRKAWREQKGQELEKEVNRVQDLLSGVTADTQDKPSTDTVQ